MTLLCSRPRSWQSCPRRMWPESHSSSVRSIIQFTVVQSLSKPTRNWISNTLTLFKLRSGWSACINYNKFILSPGRFKTLRCKSKVNTSWPVMLKSAEVTGFLWPNKFVANFPESAKESATLLSQLQVQRTVLSGEKVHQLTPKLWWVTRLSVWKLLSWDYGT